MSKSTNIPDMARLGLADADEEDLFASPESGSTTQKHTPSSNVSSATKPIPRAQSKQDAAEARDARLRAELEQVREVNRVIEGVTASLTKAKQNMATVHRTVDNASTLLATWTRILSQTEHNQRLVLNPNWQGASKDMEDMENEELRRQQDAERRAVEEQRRRDEQARKAEEEERRREAEANAKTRPGRALARTRSTRGSGTAAGSRANYTGVGGQTGRGRGTLGSSATGRTVGRGTSGLRGRGRGLG